MNKSRSRLLGAFTYYQLKSATGNLPERIGEIQERDRFSFAPTYRNFKQSDRFS